MAELKSDEPECCDYCKSMITDIDRLGRALGTLAVRRGGTLKVDPPPAGLGFMATHHKDGSMTVRAVVSKSTQETS